MDEMLARLKQASIMRWMIEKNDIAIVGSGAWATALAQVAARAHRRSGRVWLVTHTVEAARAMAQDRENRKRLPGVTLHEAIEPTYDRQVISQCAWVLLACPAQYMRAVCLDIRDHLADHASVVLCAKGIEMKSGAFMYEVAAEVLPDSVKLAALSGPNFALSVAQGQPAAVTLAASDMDHARQIAQRLQTDAFRPYAHDDIVGCMVAGSVKNMVAIGCGIISGKKMGENAAAALMTRGYAEMVRLGTACGADGATMAGLAGLGDLALSCSSDLSRNRRFGSLLGQGYSVKEAQLKIDAVVEGLASTQSIMLRADRHGVDMPICAALEKILWHEGEINTMIRGLLMRPLREEFPLRRVDNARKGRRGAS